MFETDRCCGKETAFAAGTMDMNNPMDMNMDMAFDMKMPYNSCCNMTAPTMCPPIYECPKERICHRTINYEVPHMIPCHTKMINHHVYHHTYQPCYSYSEEDEYANVYDNRCC